MANKATWVILAGGKGTRSKDPSTPKLLQRVGATDILGLLLNSLPTDEPIDTVFILNHGAERVESELRERAAAFPNARIRVLHDAGRGPVAALKSVRTIKTHETISVVLGDTAIVAPLGDYLERYFRFFAGKPAISIRQSDHLHDSNAIALDWSGSGVRYFAKGEALDSSAGILWGISGLAIIPRHEIDLLDEGLADVATAIIKSAPLSHTAFFPISHFFRDSGTPERLATIEAHLSTRTTGRSKASEVSRAALFVDRDGTLLPDIPSGRKGVRGGDVNLLVVDQIRRANSAGVPVFLCTNQPAIAKGFVTMADTYKVHNVLQDVLRNFGARIDDFLMCPHHPDSGFPGELKELKVVCECRKPGIGMLLRARSLHAVALDQSSVLIGDSETDYLTAEKAGIRFLSVDSL